MIYIVLYFVIGLIIGYAHDLLLDHSYANDKRRQKQIEMITIVWPIFLIGCIIILVNHKLRKK